MSKGPSDFNDLKQSKGLRVVKKQVDSAIDADKGTPYGPFLVRPNGVYWRRKDDEEPVYFCSPLQPKGLARSIKGENFSIVFEMKDPDKRTKTFVMPLESLHRAGGEEARLEFSRRGGFFGVGIRTRQVFSDYANAIVAHSDNLPRVTLAQQTGWLRMKDDKTVFVLPDTVIGDSPEEVVLVHAETPPSDPIRGTAAEWREKVGTFCTGNSRLLLAASVAFSGSLLYILNRESGGLHLVGASSTGKTTLLAVAASILGPPRDVIRTMNATASAFEVQAGNANDACLLLDELGESPPEQLGGVIYKLSNGVGRGRADQAGNARERRTWRLLFMTTGEIDLEAMMKIAGKRTYAGQALRHANVTSDTGVHGVFEQLHGYASGAALSEHLRQETAACYGSPFREFLKKLVEERNHEPLKLVERLKGWIERFKLLSVPEGADGQVSRVASRFALIAAAGELATVYGVTGWPAGAAFEGVLACFHSWLDRRGTTGKAEVENLIQQVETFFEMHGESRFVAMESGTRGPSRPVLNRAGFRKSTVTISGDDSVTEYFVLPSAFREMVTGFDQRWAASILAERGLIRAGKDKSSVSVNLPGMGKTRCYHFPARDIETDATGEERDAPIDLDSAS